MALATSMGPRCDTRVATRLGLSQSSFGISKQSIVLTRAPFATPLQLDKTIISSVACWEVNDWISSSCRWHTMVGLMFYASLDVMACRSSLIFSLN
jgi:hypothetical protein